MSTPALIGLRLATLAFGEPLDRLREAQAGGALMCGVDMTRLPPLDRINPATSYLRWIFAHPPVVQDRSDPDHSPAAS